MTSRTSAKLRSATRRSAAVSVEHGRIAQPIDDAFAVPARGEQAGSAHQSQMLRRVGDRQSDALGQRFDASLALGEQFQNLQPVAVAERLGDLGEAGEQRAFGIRRLTCSTLK